MTGIIKFGQHAPATMDDVAKGLAKLAAEAPPDPGGTPLLRLDKRGRWVFGPESVHIPEDEFDLHLLAGNPASVMHGYIAWGAKDTLEEGTVVGEKMVPLQLDAPERASLPNLGKGVDWQYQRSMHFQFVKGRYKGLDVLWKTTSQGATQAFTALINAIVSQQGDRRVPVCKLALTSYRHSRWGEIFKPVFEVVDWWTMEGPPKDREAELEAMAKEAAEDDGDPDTPAFMKPQRRRRRQPVDGPDAAA